MTLKQNLSQYFGYDTFKDGQEKIVNAALRGEDVLGIMPTGGGKSLCYQLPAIQMEGVTLVISPLISLMKDQVDALGEMGIPSTFLNSSLDDHTYEERMAGIRDNQYKLVYIAPERLSAYSFIELARQLNISMVAVDEAHCISQWGHDFRPHYQAIPNFIESLTPRPVVAAYTATATVKVTQEIKELLKLRDPVESIIGFDRPNLIYQVVKTGDKFTYVRDAIRKNYENASGIIYCATRKTVEGLAQKLNAQGFSAAAYHGGMGAEARQQNQHDFIHDKINIMVATNAFGMGINKPDVRFIIHYNMPQNMEAYYQEAGRGGRDGEISHCTILYSPADIVKQKRLIQMNQTSPEREKLLFENLQYLVDYCHTNECLRKKILEYFGETAIEDNCGNCGNCLDQSEMMDITLEAQKILSCIYRMNSRFGLNMVISVLRGSRNKKIMDMNLDQLSTYGLLKEHTLESLREIIMTLVAKGYVLVTADDFPVLKLTAASTKVLKGQEKVFHKKHLVEMKAVKSKSKVTGKAVIDCDEALFLQLKALRYSLSQEKELPPFMIFHDASLKEMAAYFPLNKEDFLKINGVGQAKFENYGDLFIQEIQIFADENPIEIRPRPEADSSPREATPVEKEPRGGTYEKTYEAFIQGQPLDEIAAARGLTLSTIISHLMRCDQQGKNVDWSDFVDPEKETQILAAIESVGLDALKPIKLALPESFSYNDIKIVIHKNSLV
ncbi:DNA helicase RecQ [Acetobacterium bakii]|uniref:DNA helicase RecQ n=1 Tax=Acetobacterium bakii TaxID=52689 RepID=A0A0L6U0D0_9FIRM|nr:DNA helicase RecQ [Acetobacterium bakii]KNZ41280.1 ATP-dependent DNA helicase [Acetobacterium bakii]